MDLTNLKNGIGFVTEQEIFDRLRFFMPPDEENYFIESNEYCYVKNGRYSVVGTCWHGERKKLFCIYSGTPELYTLICEMVKKAAEKIGYSVQIEESDESK